GRAPGTRRVRLGRSDGRRARRQAAVRGTAGEGAMTDAETDPLQDLFRAELREQAVALSRGLLELERAPDDPAPLDGLVQAAHGVRGAARIVHLDAAARLASGLEDLLAAALTGRRMLSADDIDLCLRVTDVLAALGETEP